MLRNLPPVAKNLLLLNVILFLVSFFLEQSGAGFSLKLEAHYFTSVFFQPYQVITHMFMHSLYDPFHIIFNMLLLVMFGAHLERLWGSRRFFIFYMSCGLGAFVLYNAIGVWQLTELRTILAGVGNHIGVIDALIEQGTITPYTDSKQFILTIQKLVESGQLSADILGNLQEIYDYSLINHSSIVGASGAIFGLLAGFAMLFPNTELMIIFIPIPIKAKYLIGGYLAFEVYNSIFKTDDHIAHLAHVGGAIVGVIFILIWRKRDRTNFY